jgi:hypothetical protein
MTYLICIGTCSIAWQRSNFPQQPEELELTWANNVEWRDQQVVNLGGGNQSDEKSPRSTRSRNQERRSNPRQYRREGEEELTYDEEEDGLEAPWWHVLHYSSFSKNSRLDPWRTYFRIWTLGLGAESHGAEVTRVGAVSHGAETPNVAADMAVTWQSSAQQITAPSLFYTPRPLPLSPRALFFSCSPSGLLRRPPRLRI